MVSDLEMQEAEDAIDRHRDRIAELEAALHIATNDKLSLLDQLDQAHQRRMAQIDYGCDLQRIIEDLCRGGPIREPKTSARHHYDMAKERLSAEALSRTGAVKVHREDVAKLVYEAMSWAAMCGPTPNGTVPVWEDRGNSLGQEEARRIADRILSALEPAVLAPIAELQARQTDTDPDIAAAINRDRTGLYLQPAAPEERQPADAVLASALKLAREYRPTMDKDILHSWASDAVKVIRVLSDRPSEQAMTDEMVSAACDAFLRANTTVRTVGFKEMRAALKAAMEAG